MSAIVSGIALCLLTYIVTMEGRKYLAARKRAAAPGHQSLAEIKSVELSVVEMTSKYLLAFMVAAISLELLDIIFRGYTAVKSWDILRSVIYERDFANIFIKQYAIGNVLPLIMFLWPGLTIRRTVIATIFVLFGVIMMRWNVVIGGQAFSLTFAGFMHYHMPIIPHSWETFKEGLFGAIAMFIGPFITFWVMSYIFPVFEYKEAH
jgi:predicted membrane protein